MTSTTQILDKEAVEKAARAIYAIADRQAYVGQYRFPDGKQKDTCLDGDFDLRSFAEAAIVTYRASAKPQGEEWKPIESAPKDGTPILICLRREITDKDIENFVPWAKIGTSIGWWSGKGWELCWLQEGSADSAGFSSWFYMGAVYALPAQPTHWQPLPAPPKKDDKT